jgi:UDP-3-O-[3-hydroxymyristoyl] glucosamine N-acyltransferase
MKLSEIANLINGELTGNGDLDITNVGKIEYARPDEITFIANPIYERYYNSTNAGAIIVSKRFMPPKDSRNIPMVYVNDPYRAFLNLLEVFTPELKEREIGIHRSAVVADTAIISNVEVSIGANCYIGDKCVIGKHVTLFPNTVLLPGVIIKDDVAIYPNVTVHNNCKIGNRVIIHSGTIIGSDGFGQAKTADGSYVKIPQKGIVVIEDDVEIGSNCTIDRATLGETKIGKGVKIDNLIQIAHNVEIGENTVIAAQTGIAGSTKIGKNCMIGGKAGFVGHIEICDNVIITAAANVSKSITDPGIYSGYRARPQKQDLKQEALLRKIEEMQVKINNLEKLLNKNS